MVTFLSLRLISPQGIGEAFRKESNMCKGMNFFLVSPSALLKAELIRFLLITPRHFDGDASYFHRIAAQGDKQWLLSPAIPLIE